MDFSGQMISLGQNESPLVDGIEFLDVRKAHIVPILMPLKLFHDFINRVKEDVPRAKKRENLIYHLLV